MIEIAEWVHFPIAKPIVLGSLIALGLAAIFYIIGGMLAAFLIFLFVGLIVTAKVYHRIRVNNLDIPPVYIDGDDICCYYDEESVLTFSLSDLYYARGKIRKFFHLLPGGVVSWGSYNYGKLIIYYYDNNRKCKFVLNCVYQPENAAVNLMDYVDSQLAQKR